MSIVRTDRLSFPWQTLDPFLFCVHHLDFYPRGNANLGPDADLKGRNMGMDFEGKDGWRMYHGHVVPGFPRHPHRGFETITIARQGFIDHSDSLGARARFGNGDIQWMTAGKGIVHSEMFPLLDNEQPNTAELFQIWLNLPKQSKFADPYFSMYWAENIAAYREKDIEVKVYAGEFENIAGVTPPPDSWAAVKEADLAIYTIKLGAHAVLSLPKAQAGTNRALYFFKGESLNVAGEKITPLVRMQLESEAVIEIQNENEEAELLYLQGRPIGEPVVQYGPFVMNDAAEIQQAILDYQRTGFGKWPFATDAPVHGSESNRFAVHANGESETP